MIAALIHYFIRDNKVVIFFLIQSLASVFISWNTSWKMNFPQLTICCCSVAKSSPALCDPMDCSTPGFFVLHYLLGFAQTRVHWVGDAIQPSHPQPPSPPALNLSQHQGLFQWVSSLHQVAKEYIGASASVSVLPMNIQGWFTLGLTNLISLHSKGLSKVFSSTTVWKH